MYTYLCYDYRMMQDHNGAKCESKVRKGPWSEEEDDLLRKCIEKYGEDSCWKTVPQRAGLNRCRKSCRWRWLNYLRPGIKRGDFSEDEANIIASQHKLLGNRWSLIAAKLPGRTINDVKNYCSTQLYKDYISSHEVTLTTTEDTNGLGIGPGNGFGPEVNEQNDNYNWLENLLGSDEYSSHNYSGPSIGPFLEDEEFDNNENMDYWISSLRDEPNLPFVMNNCEDSLSDFTNSYLRPSTQ